MFSCAVAAACCTFRWFPCSCVAFGPPACSSRSLCLYCSAQLLNKHTCFRHLCLQALVLQRGGRKILAEAEPDGRRWVAALAASVTAGPGSLHLTHGDSQAVPSGLARAATAPGLLRSQSTADTASTEADLEPMQVDSLAAAEGDVDPAGYSSFEETDLEEDEAEGGWRVRRAGAAQQAAALFELARDAVLVQPWDAAAPLPAGGAAAPAAATHMGEQARQQQGAQPPAAAEESGAHSREWRAARRGVEWRVRWLELRLTELQHQRLHYQQQLTAEQQREEAAAAAAQQAAAAPPAEQQQQQQQQGEAAQQITVQPPASATTPAEQKPAAAAGKPPLPPSARRRERQERQPLPGCQLPDLLQHPFVAQHSVVGARAAAAAGGGLADAQPAGPSAVDSDDFPAEAHAALELLDHKLSSLRRQLMALQQPAGVSAFRGVQAVRLPGRPPGPGRRPGGSGVFTPRSGGATPRGTPRAGSLSLYRDGSLSKRRRVQVGARVAERAAVGTATFDVCYMGAAALRPRALPSAASNCVLACVHSLQEYDVGELITPLGAPKFVERAQVGWLLCLGLQVGWL